LSVLLQQIADYADRLSDSAPVNYLETPIRYVIELDSTGHPQGIIDQAQGGTTRDKRGKATFAPHIGRTSGVKPKLLADNGEYVLGIVRDAAKQGRVDLSHQGFVSLVGICAQATEAPAVTAVQAFLADPSAVVPLLPADFDASMVVTFSVDGVLPISLLEVQHFWATYADAEEDDSEDKPAVKKKLAKMATQCLVCGEIRPPVSVMVYTWKGIPGGQSSGMVPVSANAPAFLSYNMKSSQLAPICAACSERVGKAANALLGSEMTRVRVGPTAYIFWTREKSGFNWATFINDPKPEDVKALLTAAQRGQRAAAAMDAERQGRFYAAAFSASGARVVVRDWLDMTVGEAQAHLARYFRLQEIVGLDGAEAPPLKLVALAGATVRELKDLTPRTTKTLLSLALGGGPVPKDLLFEAVRRCRADGGVTRPQAALIKMVLLSERERQGGEDSVTEQELVRLDPGNQAPAYLCGRLLTVLESIQRAALGDVNATIVDRYFGTASSAPAAVFGKLLRGAQPHLSKLRRDRPGSYRALQQRLEEVQAGLQGFPKTLSLTDQGLFALGYYHQRAADRAGAAAARARREGQLAIDLTPDAAAPAAEVTE